MPAALSLSCLSLCMPTRATERISISIVQSLENEYGDIHQFGKSQGQACLKLS